MKLKKNKELELSVIIPLFNEQDTIKTILEKINNINIFKEIIVINDGSNDNSLKILKSNDHLYDYLLSFKKNRGKGFACKKGIEISNGKFVIIQDADLEYNPKNYIDLLNETKNGYKVVYGSRVLKGGDVSNQGGVRPVLSKFANFILTKLSNFINKQKLTDAHTCYKLFDRNVIQKIDLHEKRFAFCPEVTTKISKLGIQIKEVPIDYFGRSYKEGKKIKLKDAFEAIFALIKYKLF